jgi:hypothetical protein
VIPPRGGGCYDLPPPGLHRWFNGFCTTFYLYTRSLWSLAAGHWPLALSPRVGPGLQRINFGFAAYRNCSKNGSSPTELDSVDSVDSGFCTTHSPFGKHVVQKPYNHRVKLGGVCFLASLSFNF